MDKGDLKSWIRTRIRYIGDHYDALPSQFCNLHNGHVLQM